MKKILLFLILVTISSCTVTNGSYRKMRRGWVNQDLRDADIPDPDTTTVTTEGPIIQIIKQ